MVIQTNLHRKKYLWQQNSGRAKSISVYHKWKPKIKKKGHSFTIEVCLSNRKDSHIRKNSSSSKALKINP